MPGSCREKLSPEERQLRTILSVFLRLKQIRQPVRMHNLVKGVPVSFDAYVDMVRGDRVVQFTVHRYQLTALHIERRVVITAKPFAKTVGAGLDSLDSSSRTACLNGFRFVDRCAVQRNYYRVQIENDLPVAVISKDNKNFGRIMDLSISGLALRLQSGHGLEAGKLVLAAFRVPLSNNGDESLLKIKGRVVRVMPGGESEVVALEIEPGKAERDSLARFISESQNRIVREFKEKVDEMEDRFRH
jgi:hypothetical protein